MNVEGQPQYELVTREPIVLHVLGSRRVENRQTGQIENNLYGEWWSYVVLPMKHR